MDRRRVNRWGGAFLLAVGAGAFALAFPPQPLLAVQTLLLAAAGALYVAAGVTDRYRWSLLSGLGNVALGASLAVSGLGDVATGGGSLFYTVAVVLGGLTLAAIGVLYAIDYEGFDTEP